MTVSLTSNLSQGGGANARMVDSDPSGSAQPSIDSPHHRIHQGFMFTCFKFGRAVANRASIKAGLITHTAECHIVFDAVIEEGPCNLYIYEDPTYKTEPMDWGIAQMSFRTNRSVARTDGEGEGSDFVWYNDPTILTHGTLITRYMLVGGGRGSLSNREELVLARNRKYLFRLANNSGSASDLFLKAIWYTPRYSYGE